MSIWQKILGLFRFDFRAAFGSRPRLPGPGSNAVASDDIALPFELDVRKLDHIRYRRQILDWRDAFSVRLLTDGKDLFRQLSEQVDRRADEIGILQRLFAKPAAEVLKDNFFALVRIPLAERVNDAETQLEQLVRSLPLAPSRSLSLVIDDIDPSLSILGDLDFTPSSQESILAKLNQLVFGERGIIDSYLQRAREIAHSLLRTLDARP